MNELFQLEKMETSMLYELHKVFRRKTNLAMAGGLFFSMMIYTCLLVLGTMDLNSEYLRAGLPNIDTSMSFYFVSSSFMSRIPDPIFNIFSLLLFFFLIPILLTFVGATSFYDDYRTLMINQVIAKKRVLRFLVDKQIVSILCGLGFVFLSLVFQMLFATLLISTINNDLVHFYHLSRGELISSLKASLIISVYYASLISLSTSLSFLISKVKYLSYISPLLLSLTLSFSFRRVPLALAFTYSGYKDESQSFLYISMFSVVLIMIAIDIFYWIHSRKRII
ncbi:MAG: hypothetical protein ACOWWR_12250 [Eubacteriales bacterium]